MTNSESTTVAPPVIHNGTYTVSSEKTGGRVTFRIRTVRKGKLEGKRIVELLTGPSNEDDYQGVAFLDGKRINVWRRFSSGSGPITAGAWTSGYNDLERKLGVLLGLATTDPYEWASKGYELLKSGTCIRCNRTLTVPLSIKLGVGPECASKVGIPFEIES